MRKPTRRLRETQAGLTLIEIVIATTVLAIAAIGIAGSMMAGVATNRIYQQNTLLVARAQHHVETLYNLQLGQDSDPVATQADMDLVFSGDSELGPNPPTLTTLAKGINLLPGFFYEFAPPNLGFSGTLLVRVTNNVATTLDYSASIDANDDGIPDDGVASMAEGIFSSQFPAAGVYENDATDDGRELFAFEIFYRPPLPAGAVPRFLLRAFRAQDY